MVQRAIIAGKGITLHKHA